MSDRISPYEGENPRSIEIGEFVDIVEAMAERELLEQDFRDRTMEQITGMPQQSAPLELRRRVATAKATLKLTRWENPNTDLNFEDALDSVMDDSYPLIAEELSQPGITVTPMQAREILISLGQTVSEVTATPGEDATTAFSKIFETAQAIAKEEGVSVSQVYRDEKLYTGIFRKIYTLEEYATELSRVAENVSSEATIRTIFAQVFNATLSDEEREHKTEQELAAMLEKFQSDPKIIAIIDQQMAITKSTARQFSTTQLARTWGKDALHRISPELREKLGIPERRIRAAEIGNMTIIGASAEQETLLRAREAFVQEFFAKRGWDANNPTLEQLLEVREQPGWQNPTIE